MWGMLNTSSVTSLIGPLWHRAVVPGRVTLIVKIHLSKDYLFSMVLGVQQHRKETHKKLLKTFKQNINMNVQWIRFPNL